MPDAQPSPRSKRAVPTARAVAAEAPGAKRHVAPGAAVLQDPTPSTHPGFRARPPAPVADDSSTNYALRLTEALEAISSAQNTVYEPDPIARHAPPPPRGRGPSALARLSDRFANLPPIRLPIGPPIPWRFGLPALVLIALAMFFVARPMSQSDPQISRLPTLETYPAQQVPPLFADAQPTQAPVATAQPGVPTAQLGVPTAPLGVADSNAVGFDALDVGVKLIAVLALAYGSLLLLKKTGMGGAAAIKNPGKSSGMQVIASLSLAPNRTVHLLKVPGGKTLLVGATPNQVNLIVDLGEVSEELESEVSGSFFDILKGKLPQ